jgi:dihydropteroate synthase
MAERAASPAACAPAAATVPEPVVGHAAAAVPALAAEHVLSWRRPVAGATREGEVWVWRWRGTQVMGVVNVTPDSFSDGGRTRLPAAAIAAGVAAWRAGAAVVDVGGASTRPGAEPPTSDVELDRVRPVLRGLREACPEARVSIDTWQPEVAAVALAEGADLVNDVSGLRDPELRRLCAAAGVPAVVGHLRGVPATMHLDVRFDDVVREVRAELLAAAERALAAGVPSLLLDPGIGFGKRLEHNRELLLATDVLAALGFPLLVGASRKGSLGRVAGEPRPERRDAASIAAHLVAAARGAAMVRAHDVAGHVQALAVWRWLHG